MQKSNLKIKKRNCYKKGRNKLSLDQAIAGVNWEREGDENSIGNTCGWVNGGIESVKEVIAREIWRNKSSDKRENIVQWEGEKIEIWQESNGFSYFFVNSQTEKPLKQD